METTQTVDVTVLIPAFNEEEAIGDVIDHVRRVMATTGRSFEILVVDDCSTDNTGDVARRHGARVFRHIFNQGSGASRRTGIREARSEIIVMLDGDGTYEPATIPEMLDFFPEYDQVNGARTSEQGTYKFLRMPAKWFIRRLAIYLSGRPIPDLNTGLKAFKRRIMMHYLWLLPDGFSCVTTMTLAFLTNNHSVRYVPTPYYKRVGKSKFHPIKDTLKYLSVVVRMCAYFRPLRVFGPLGGLLVLIGAGRMIYGMVSSSLPAFATVDVVLVCTGIMVVAIGILLDVIISQRRSQGV